MSAVGLLVVAPVIVVLASYVIRPLLTTRELVGEVTDNAVAYVGALRRLVAKP